MIAHPPFRLSPGLGGRYQMLAYSSSDPVRAIEYFIPAQSDEKAISKAKFEADYACRNYVVVRDPSGHVIFDGPAHNRVLIAAQKVAA